ncbi:MAG: SDR family oxidoreductase [Pseudomonadales bacterium]|nr:SDR family oxidoreductase [Pseudomonadales bacterium]
MADLTSKIAIVTGAGQGIGKAIAIRLAQAGADVVVAELLEERIAETVDAIEKLGRKAIGVQADVRDNAQVVAMVNAAVENFGRVDILVNNAGTDIVRDLVDLSDEEWDIQIDVNLKGTFYCCRAAVPEIVKAGGGAIVNIASAAGYISYPGGTAYAAAKAGVMALTRSLAGEVGKQNIRVNAIAPGPIDTPLARSVFAEMAKRDDPAIFSSGPIRRMGRPEEIANTVAFLASEESSYITGDTISVSGGTYMH